MGVLIVEGYRLIDCYQRFLPLARRKSRACVIEQRLRVFEVGVIESITVFALERRTVPQVRCRGNQDNFGPDGPRDINHACQVVAIVVEYLFLKFGVAAILLGPVGILQYRVNLTGKIASLADSSAGSPAHLINHSPGPCVCACSAHNCPQTAHYAGGIDDPSVRSVLKKLIVPRVYDE